MKKVIEVSQISIVHGITLGESNRMSVKAIIAGQGVHITPTVKVYQDHYALVFGINHLYAALERHSTTIEVEVIE